jgi:hypothetical protein
MFRHQTASISLRWAVPALLICVLTIMLPADSRPAYAAKGDFSLDFVAAAPYSYDHFTGGGAYDDRTIGTTTGDVVESLEGGDFKCGDVVTFLTAVTVADTAQAATDAPQTIEIDFSFLADSTGQPGVALGDIVSTGANYGAIQDLVAGENTVDDAIRDDRGSTATLINEQLVGTMFDNGVLNGTVVLTDLERNEQVVVRMDVKLLCQPGSRPTGNLQGDLKAARLTTIKENVPVDPPAAISAGNQTIPFKNAGDVIMPAVDVVKTVTTAGGTCPGADTLTINEGETVRYCYQVSNPSDVTDPPGAALYNVTLVDDNGTPGDSADDFTVVLTGLTDQDGDGTADDLAPAGIASGEAVVTLPKPGTVVNTATAAGYDSIMLPTAYTDTDIATVTVNDIPPTVELAKSADPLTMPEPGGDFNFTPSIQNTSAEAVTITQLGDDNALSQECLDLVGSTVPAGGTVNCTYTVSHTNAGSYANTASVTVADDDGSEASDTDTATVEVTDVAPAVDLKKSASPGTMRTPGGDFLFTLEIHNTSVEPVTITQLADTEALSAECLALVGTSIPAGGTVSCTYTVTHTGEGEYPNTASVTVVDDDGNPAGDFETVTVTVLNPTSVSVSEFTAGREQAVPAGPLIVLALAAGLLGLLHAWRIGRG